MSSITRWWDGRSDGEKFVLGFLGGFLVVATGGALAYAIGVGGVVIATGETVILIGSATSLRG